jgi:hypothetical protein
MCPPKTTHENTYFRAFLRSDSPQPTLPQPEFVPMFTQAVRIGGTKALDDPKPVHPSIPSFLSDLPSMLPEPIEVDAEDEDLYKQHMVVVDGWRKYLTSFSFFRLKTLQPSPAQKQLRRLLPQALVPHRSALAQVKLTNFF